MDGNGKDNNPTRQIFRRVHFVRKGEKLKMHMIDWCEGGQQLSDIVTDKVGDNDLKPIIKYIMVRFDN